MVRYFRKSWFTARPKRCRLSAEEADQLFGKLAELHTAGLSLSAGLRAAVTDSADGRLAQTCLQLADRLDQGMSLDQALGIGVSSSSPPVLPHQVYTHSLIAVSLRHHDLGAALETLLDHQRQVREIGSRVIGSLAYPLSVLLFAMLILVMLAFWVVPVFGEMFSDFGLNLPPLTRAVIRISALLTQAMTGWQTLAGWSLLAVAGLLLGIAVGGLRLGWFGARHRQELVGSIPMKSNPIALMGPRVWFMPGRSLSQCGKHIRKGQKQAQCHEHDKTTNKDEDERGSYQLKYGGPQFDSTQQQFRSRS